MHYKFPINPLSFSNGRWNETYVEIGTTIWTIRPVWRRPTQLSAVEILRSDNKDGIVHIELYLNTRAPVYTPDLPSWTLNEYFTYSECLLTLSNLPFLISIRDGHHLVGHVVISSNCQSANESVVPTDSSPSKLSSDFLRLLDNPTSFFPDATLRSGSVEIPVHRSVLSVRSPVLAAMFSTQMREGLGSTVDITDIRPEVLQSTLRYIYGGKTDGLTDTLAADMLFAAEKYQLEELKAVCIRKLASSVTVNNVCRILVLGYLHDKSLKSCAVDFLCRCNCFSKLSQTEEWEQLKEEYPGLTMEVMESIIKCVEQKNDPLNV